MTEETLDDLFAQLKDPDPGTRCRAAKALGQLPSHPPRVVDRLLQAFHDEEAMEYAGNEGEGPVSEVLAEIQDSLLLTVPASLDRLCEALSDESVYIRRHVADTFRRMCRKELIRDAIPYIVHATHDGDRAVRGWASVTLRLTAENQAALKPVIESAQKDYEP